MFGTGQALLLPEVEVLGVVALNAGRIIPEPAIRALTFMSRGVDYLAARTTLADLIFIIVVFIGRARHTLCPIKDRGAEGAILALLGL